jgi:purine catabolism regulator
MECLTVRELVCEAELGLVLVTGEPGLDNVIEGIHLSDLEDPTPWMTSGMVLITTGESFAGDTRVGLQLLDRLKGSEAVALGVGVGHYLDHVPPVMIERAQALRIPLFEAPLSVPFRTIVTYVFDALASSDMHRMRRSLAVQSHLLDLLIEERSVSDLIASLSAILSVPVVLFDAHGTVIAPTGGGAQPDQIAPRLWAEYSRVEGAVGPLGVLESGHDRLYYHKVCLHGVVERVLAAKAPQAPGSGLVDTALSFVHRLLSLDLLRTHEELLVRRRIRSLLLEDFLAERGASDERLLRLQEQDIDLARPWRLLVVEVEPPVEASRSLDSEPRTFALKSRLVDVIEEYLGSRSWRFLALLQGDAVVVLIAVDGFSREDFASTLDGVRCRLAELTGSCVAIGCSAPSERHTPPLTAMNQAREALEQARTGLGEKTRLFEDLPEALRMVNGLDPEMMLGIYNRFIAPLARHDAEHHTLLLPTLRTLFANHLSPHETAAALFVHRNTLHKRLRRIESVLDVDLDRMDDVLELYIGMRVGELHPELTVA